MDTYGFEMKCEWEDDDGLQDTMWRARIGEDEGL